MWKKIVSYTLVGAFGVALSGCGTLFHAERKGQDPSDKLDPEVVILDCCGFLFGVIPGVVALVLDFNNKTIYYTKAEARKLSASNFTPSDLARMQALRVREMTPRAIEEALASELGQQVSLNHLQWQAVR